MTAPHSQNDSIEALEVRYNEITALYDYAEELVATVEHNAVADPATQLDLVESLVTEISNATDVLSEQFILIAESRRKSAPGKASSKRVEKALRKIYVAIQEYHERVKSAANVANAVVEKIQRHVEKVIGIFLEFVQISLLNLMGKAEVEALRVRDANIALLMHRQAMSQQQ